MKNTYLTTALALGLGLTAAPLWAASYYCEASAECDENGCAEISTGFSITEAPDGARYEDELELYSMTILHDAVSGDTSYASVPTHGATKLITRFANGVTVVSTHFLDGFSAGTLTTYATCAEDS